MTTRELPDLLSRFHSFMGGEHVVRGRVKAMNTRAAKARGFTRLYIQKQHPWWHDLANAPPINQNLSDLKVRPLQQFFEDAVKVVEVAPTMPDQVREKYRTDLLSDNAADALLEVELAWRYLNDGWRLEWPVAPTGQGGRRVPEFSVHKGAISFGVEAKNISINIGRNIQRADFYRFADIVVAAIAKAQVHGEVDVLVPKKLSGNEQWMHSVTKDILKAFKSSLVQTIQSSEATITLHLRNNDGEPVDVEQFMAAARRDIPTEHAVVQIPESRRNPIVFRCRSGSREDLSEPIYKRLKDGHEQLGGNLGFMVGHIPEVDDMRLLQSEGALRAIAIRLLLGEGRTNIGGLLYQSDVRRIQTEDGVTSHRETLYWANPECKAAPDGFPFLGIRSQSSDGSSPKPPTG